MIVFVGGIKEKTMKHVGIQVYISKPHTILEIIERKIGLSSYETKPLYRENEKWKGKCAFWT